MEQQQVALPVEVIEIIRQKPEATLMCLASFFQFGLHREKGVMLKDEALWEFLLDQIIKLLHIYIFTILQILMRVFLSNNITFIRV